MGFTRLNTRASGLLTVKFKYNEPVASCAVKTVAILAQALLELRSPSSVCKMALDGEKVLLLTAIQAAVQAGASPKVVAGVAAATLRALRQQERGSSFSSVVEDRLNALRPCLEAQEAAAGLGLASGSARGLVDRRVSTRANVAKHVFGIDRDFSELSDADCKRLQRGGRGKLEDFGKAISLRMDALASELPQLCQKLDAGKGLVIAAPSGDDATRGIQCNEDLLSRLRALEDRVLRLEERGEADALDVWLADDPAEHRQGAAEVGALTDQPSMPVQVSDGEGAMPGFEADAAAGSQQQPEQQQTDQQPTPEMMKEDKISIMPMDGPISEIDTVGDDRHGRPLQHELGRCPWSRQDSGHARIDPSLPGRCEPDRVSHPSTIQAMQGLITLGHIEPLDFEEGEEIGTESEAVPNAVSRPDVQPGIVPRRPPWADEEVEPSAGLYVDVDMDEQQQQPGHKEEQVWQAVKAQSSGYEEEEGWRDAQAPHNRRKRAGHRPSLT